MGGLKRAYRVDKRRHGRIDSLDEATWRDLDMDPVFRYIDRTLTLPGELRLYEILRNPTLCVDTLRARSAVLRFLQENVSFRQSTQLELAQIGRRDPLPVISFLSKSAPPKVLWQRLLPLFSFAAIAAMLSPLIVSVPVAAVFIAIVICTNFAITYFVVRGYVDSNVQAIRYLGKVVRHAEVIGAHVARLDPEFSSLFPAAPASNSKEIRRLQKIIPLIFPERAYSADAFQLLAEYASAIFLIEARAYNAVVETVEAHRDEIRALFTFVGELDALLAVASFRESQPGYCEPDLHSGARPLQIQDARHVLVENATPNSIAIAETSAFITGANMSGKTTFLKTVALNAVMAQSIYTCFAARYTAGLYTIISSINVKDNARRGKSYYYVELERMQAIIRAAQDGGHVLCAVDELLRGTNANERRAASAAILHGLDKPNVVALISSHDTDLSRLLDGVYTNYHFESKVTGNGLDFDYRLRLGQANSGNAIALMKEMGFPRQMVAEAEGSLRSPLSDA